MIFLDPLAFVFVIPVVLYAELHYRFPFLPFSRYYTREPEIIADVPHRVEPGESLPLLLLVKDAHRFPVHMKRIEITMSGDGGFHELHEIKKDLILEEPWWFEIVELDLKGFSGHLSVNVLFEYFKKNAPRKCVNHNVPGSGHLPLSVTISSTPLPGKKSGWHWGDLHCHTRVTEDFVEFGAPLDATREAAKAAGLSFVAITDHSYDIDDVPGSWKETDPQLTKWNQTLTEIGDLNKRSPPVLIPGEELSCANSRGKNVHALILNHPEFLPGSGDSGERWFNTSAEHRIHELQGILDPDALAIASHPRYPFTFPQRFFLNRSVWEKEDFEAPGIAGFEILNGSLDAGFYEGLDFWIKSLLKGRKSFIYAGNDAHGNFNRFRQIKVPSLSVWDHEDHILGKCRTGIHLDGPPTLMNIIRQVRQGKCVISNGPLVTITARGDTSSATLGESIFSTNLSIDFDMESTPELGELWEAKLYWGDIEKGEERVVSALSLEGSGYQGRRSVELEVAEGRGYVRAELATQTETGGRYDCYTNPIWVNG